METQAVSQLQEAKSVCVEAIETIATAWEYLIDDAVAEKLFEQAGKVDLQMLALKDESKKLPMKENITWGTNLKELLDNAKMLHDQETMCNKEMTEQHAKAEWITKLIHSV